MDALKVDKVHWWSVHGRDDRPIHCPPIIPIGSGASPSVDTAAFTPKESPADDTGAGSEIAREKGVAPLLEPTMERWFTPSLLHLETLRCCQ